MTAPGLARGHVLWLPKVEVEWAQMIPNIHVSVIIISKRKYPPLVRFGAEGDKRVDPGMYDSAARGPGSEDRCRDEPSKHQIIVKQLALPKGIFIIGRGCSRKGHKLIGLSSVIEG